MVKVIDEDPKDPNEYIFTPQDQFSFKLINPNDEEFSFKKSRSKSN